MFPFIKRLVIFLIIGYILNLAGAEILKIKQRVLTAKRVYYPNLRMDEFYNQDEIDIVFLGSSRCYQGFDPAVIDSVTGMNSFNLGSSSQTPRTSYFLLKEVYRKFEPEFVIFELSIDVLKTSQLVNGGYIIDAMENSYNKFDFFLNGFDFDEQIELLLPFYRYRRNIGFFYYTLFESVEEHYDRKRIYRGKGFVENYNDDTITKEYEFTRDDSVRQSMDYLNKINTLVKEHGSELILVCLPYPQGTEIINKAEYIEFIRNQTEEMDVPLISYLNEEEYRDRDYFADANHLNYKGVKLVSKEIADFVRM